MAAGSVTPDPAPRVRRLLGQLAWAAPIAYLVLIGGTPVGELNGWVQALNGVLALGIIAVWLRRAPRDADRLDGAIIVALLLFLTSAVLSLLPRQSFAAAIQATAITAGFYLARRGLVGETRRSVQALLGWLCLAVVLLTLPAWVAVWVGFLDAVGWSQAPPLTIWLPPDVFDNRHYVGTLVLLLAPALWGEAFRGRWRLIALAGTLGAAAVVLMDGSRTLAAAAIVASLAVGGMHLGAVATRLRGRIGVVALASAVVVAVGAAIASPLLLERITNLPKLLARFGFLGQALDVWLGHPVAGVGPGVYPFSYFLTDYFADISYAPRHPDNAAVQLLVEGGVLGLTAGVIVVVAIVSGARGRWRANPAATWALTAFSVACIGTNPSDFLFLVVPAVIWAAVLVPATPMPAGLEPTLEARPRSRARARLLGLAAVPVGAVVLLTSGGSVAYQLARDVYASGDTVAAARAVDVAAALDPGQAIYWRERGALLLTAGDAAKARRAFERALRLVPWDPGAMRGLALADLALDDPRAALDDASVAWRAQPHSAASAIVVAVAAGAADDPETSSRALSSALLEAPWFAFVPWSDTVLDGFDMRRALASAATAAEGYRVGETGIDVALVMIMAGAQDASAAAASASSDSARALVAVAECNEEAAQRAIRLAGTVDREYDYFWVASAVISQAYPRLGAFGPEPAVRFLGFGSSPGPLTTSLVADGGDDALRYRRAALEVTTPATAMPAIFPGRWLLTNDPAAALSALGAWPPACNSAAIE